MSVLARQQDDVLKEFLDLVEVLNYQAVRLGSFYSRPPDGGPEETENDSALSYIQTSLEDLAATAVGIAKSSGPEPVPTPAQLRDQEFPGQRGTDRKRDGKPAGALHRQRAKSRTHWFTGCRDAVNS